MKVSVVIPAFNRAALLPRALDSLRAQTRAPDEVIVVDDGSTDGTGDLVADRYPEYRCLRQSNRGVSAARNLGIRAARNPWIALLDSDDAWLPDKLAAQEDLVAREPAALLCHTEELWVRNGVRVNPMRKHRKSGGWIFRRCLPLCVISPSSALVHRDLFEQVGLFDESLPACEDYDMWLRVCARHPVAFDDRPRIVKFGGHDDQLSRRHWGMDRFRVQALRRIIDTVRLDEGDRAAAASTLVRKATILANGARKRGRLEAWRDYAALADRYRPMSAAMKAGHC